MKVMVIRFKLLSLKIYLEKLKKLFIKIFKELKGTRPSRKSKKKYWGLIFITIRTTEKAKKKYWY